MPHLVLMMTMNQIFYLFVYRGCSKKFNHSQTKISTIYSLKSIVEYWGIFLRRINGVQVSLKIAYPKTKVYFQTRRWCEYCKLLLNSYSMISSQKELLFPFTGHRMKNLTRNVIITSKSLYYCHFWYFILYYYNYKCMLQHCWVQTIQTTLPLIHPHHVCVFFTK